MQNVDVAVIGMGPGGEHVAGPLADQGLRVLGIDSGLVGGECPYWGCVPTKMMVRAGDALAEARRVPQLAGSTGTVQADWSTVASRIRTEATDTWTDQVAVDRFTAKGGIFVRGSGRILGPHCVEVSGSRYSTGRGIVVSTGSRPAVPPIPGLAAVDFWTNHEFVQAEALPSSLIILGGGAIGCEIGQVAARFGVRVTLVEAADRLLPADEPEAGRILADVFATEGIEVHLGSGATSVSRARDDFEVTLASGGVVSAERLLVATGRRVDLSAVGLETVGVPADSRFAPIDERCRVADGVWAVGDVTGKGAFTHVAMYQADIVVRDVLGKEVAGASYHALPRVTFTQPEVGSVGLTEAQARETLSSIRVGVARVPETARGWMHQVGNQGVIKVIEDSERGVLVGACAMGPSGGEVLGALAVAVHAAIPVSSLTSMMYAYPTFHRGIEDALRSLSPIGDEASPGSEGATS
ncbi:MAG: dihydrolipoyl dehydrogenase family protein [Actinomycetales bacterium]